MESIWMSDYKKYNFGKLKNKTNTEVLIIGGGLAGLMTAYNLMKNNISFILVEAELVAAGVSSKTTAKLTVGHDTFYQKIKNMHGIKRARAYYESQMQGLELIKKIIKEENIKCDFISEDIYIYANDIKGIKTLNKEYNVLKDIDANAKLYFNGKNAIKFKQAICYKDGAIFNPMKYMMGILNILVTNNIPIYEKSRVTKITKMDDYYEILINDTKTINANKIIMSCHYPILNPSGLYFTKIYQSASYAIAFKTDLKIDSSYVCVDPPYYTLRRYNKNTLIIGGSDHYSGIDINFKNCFRQLEKKIFALDKNAKIIKRWWTEDCMPIDSLPYVGHYSKKHKNILLITGFGKWGFTNSHIAALNITKMLLGEKYDKLYKTNRWTLLKNLKNTMRMIIHSIDGLVISKILVRKGRLSDVKVDTGKVMKYKGMNILVYKEKNNEYIILKNKCTHMGCSLFWNNVSKVWQSKCHGSVFDKYGNVLEGPALRPLERVK